MSRNSEDTVPEETAYFPNLDINSPSSFMGFHFVFYLFFDPTTHLEREAWSEPVFSVILWLEGKYRECIHVWEMFIIGLSTGFWGFWFFHALAVLDIARESNRVSDVVTC